MIGFKAFNEYLICRDFQFEIGDTYELDCKPIPHKQGFHFCKTIEETYEYYDMSEDTRICKIEAIGDIETYDNITYCTNKIIICEEIVAEWYRKCNNNDTSSGYCNSGEYNSGNHNTGEYNSGNCNSGEYNSGDHNTGDYNSGCCNSGDFNTGCCNSGHHNTGHFNTGYFNTGDFNLSDHNSGLFNTKYHTMLMFDKPSDWTYDQWIHSTAKQILDKIVHNVTEWIDMDEMTDEEKQNNPSYKTCHGYLKVLDEEENVKIWWDSLTEEEKEEIYSLPNFDMYKFKKCIGLA